MLPVLRRRGRTSKQQPITALSALFAPDQSDRIFERGLHPFVRYLSASGGLDQMPFGHQIIKNQYLIRSRVRVTPRVKGGALMPHFRSTWGRQLRPQLLTTIMIFLFGHACEHNLSTPLRTTSNVLKVNNT
ncbi:hypothetical protein AUEXF2481DRAFT_621940 [Aureobasidium subglaciale EXF-2481]|uniref:Uncharacterized protein n=1 Tax=Aureobasidium subglaciale (strain EXF-2481) TaxID=1043005 RepID=A0A074YGK7_AURSE|nr:uncharacterized protein AUEXF2481DRAFT_621940 [Aureobasidium subglaciale EXF-2481]KEQ96963.1 hypothetical protein AUEXF2481DRAFT_621940 [Aureobasidium subglaciale EXF-2481]